MTICSARGNAPFGMAHSLVYFHLKSNFIFSVCNCHKMETVMWSDIQLRKCYNTVGQNIEDNFEKCNGRCDSEEVKETYSHFETLATY